MTFHRIGALVSLVSLDLIGAPALAHGDAAVVGACSDFLLSYSAGPAGGDLAVIAAAVFYRGAERNFDFSAILANTVDPTPGALYVRIVHKSSRRTSE